mmetsp:Transcript_31692/g.67107  ORF Transcript_31692/g.67107 Transcript_31692/m.67107 type:complete len:432 (-) Transcript_31692:86-1381(-)
MKPQDPTGFNGVMTAKAILAIRNLLSSAHIKKKHFSIGDKGDAAMNNSKRTNGDGGAACNAPSGGRGARSNNTRGSGISGNDSNNNDESNIDDREPIDANALLPRYLYPLVRHYHDDFYVSRSFDPRLIVQLMAEGFLPIATRGYLLPKLHVERCVLELNPTSKLHISRSTRRKSKKFLLSVNECFDEVVAGCHRQHGTNWLYPPIVAAFRAIHQRTTDANSGGVHAMIMSNDSMEPVDVTPVRLYSVEVWNAETGALAGGELGYSVGGIYSSLTGFSNEDAAGSVQLVALGKLLTKVGFEYWDLGMALDYKTRLGAELMRRSEFVRKVKRTRVENKGVVLRIDARRSQSGNNGSESRRNAKEFVDWERPVPDVIMKDAKDNGSSKAAATQNGNSLEQKTKKNDIPQTQPSSPSSDTKQNRKRPHEEGKGG